MNSENAPQLEIDSLDVMAIGAHPDDIEIGCGGTLASLARQGYQVAMVDLTDGEPTPLCPSPEIRLAEAAAAAKQLGIAGRITLDLPNRRLFDDFESRLKLARLIRRYRPKVVIGLGSKTPMASPDHFQAVQIIDAAIFYAKLSKWDEYFNGMPTHLVQRQVYYSLRLDGIEGWQQGQFTVDISDTLEVKLAAIRCYQSQFPPEKAYLFERVRAHALAAGADCGFLAGEILVHTKPIGSKNLMQLLGVS